MIVCGAILPYQIQISSKLNFGLVSVLLDILEQGRQIHWLFDDYKVSVNTHIRDS